MELRRPQFYFRYGYLPVLTMVERQLRIRYNRVMLDLFTPEPEAELKALMDRLDQLIEECSFSFALSQGDCMILNNHRCVHGRTAFEDDGRRLMKRVRLNLSAG
jgi:alpha-ketoglutarate-dependent taurine dioxygenase